MIPSLEYDALVAGGGLAGSALAIAAAQAGHHVLLIEKSREPRHKVCGEFLSPESIPLLRQAGIVPEELDAQTIHSVRLATREVFAEVRLPAPALSVTRRTLDEALLQHAQRAGATLLRGCTVESLAYCVDRGSIGAWQARVYSSAMQTAIAVRGRDAFLATGKHDLRGWPREAQSCQRALVAMKMYFALAPRQQEELAQHVELIVYPGGYAGLQPVEGGCVNLCALITREKLRQLDSRWDLLLDHMRKHSPHLAGRLSGAVPVLQRPLTLSPIPYGYCAAAPVNESIEPMPWRLGDQAAVIPSFCGDGMAIALHTAQRAAQLYLEGKSSSVFQMETHRQFEHSLYFSTMLSRLIIAMPSFAQAARIWPSALSAIFTATRVPGINIHAALRA